LIKFRDYGIGVLTLLKARGMHPNKTSASPIEPLGTPVHHPQKLGNL